MRRLLSIASAGLSLIAGCGKVAPPEPYGAIPTPQQVEWQKMEMNMFAHFGPNTFTGLEWGLGTEAEDIFNPTELDCGQWASIAKAAGFKGIIITGKHHDGFCLWPNPVSTHTVAQSPWKDGKGDVLKELSEACEAAGIMSHLGTATILIMGLRSITMSLSRLWRVSMMVATGKYSSSGSTVPTARAPTVKSRNMTGLSSTRPC